MEDCFVDMTVALDKLDKVQWSGVEQEMVAKGIAAEKVITLREWLEKIQSNSDEIRNLLSSFGTPESIVEFEFINNAAEISPLVNAQWKWDFTLARGLNYYTGFIFEVKAIGVEMGSIGGGGRYDDLTGIFGVKDLSGVGISFGADRIYDVMESLNLFPSGIEQTTKVLVAYFNASTISKSVQLVYDLRENGISAELYPDEAKMKKQFKYADDRHIPFVLLIGEDELNADMVNVKNMHSGHQELVNAKEVVERLRNELI
jgi:histidyl-tRNA synthetase